MAEGRQPRLKELAHALGLSITTVSRALAGYSDVSPATRERVRDLAARTGYVPSRAARMLVSGRSDFAALVLPVRDNQFIDAFLGDFVSGLGEGLVRHGRDLLIAAVAKGQDELAVLAHVIDGRRADGIVLNRTRTHDPRVRFLIERGFPFVSHGRILDAPGPYVWFDTDGEAAFADAARLLVGLGHRNFGLLTLVEPYSFARLRRRGAERALHTAGLALAEDRVVAAAGADRESAKAAARRLLGLAPRPTAILCVTDALALALLEEAARAGITVPDDLSVVGFDDSPVAVYGLPPLTTFDQRTHDSAVTVAGMLARLIEQGPDAVESRLVKPDFVARASHGPAPRDRQKRRGGARRPAGPQHSKGGCHEIA